MTVGERIKAKREELSLSQGDLAKKMQVSRQAISKAELHDGDITAEKVCKFAQALNTTPAYLMGYESKSPVDSNDILLAELVDIYMETPINRRQQLLNVVKINKKAPVFGCSSVC